MGEIWILFALMNVIVVVLGGPSKDLVESLPGQPSVKFKQYAGYVEVDEQAGRALFYYFVEAEKNPHSKPLALWLNGGPGCSSIGGGAFTELGPFYPRGDGRGLIKNPKSWNKVSNLLFVESPAGVGWSYSNTSSDYMCGDASTAADMQVFLLKWFEKFPEYRSSDFFLTGESYAGHYIPQLADRLLDHNKMAGGFQFHIKGIAIGNPLLKLDVDAAASWEYFWSHGLISEETNSAIMDHCNFNDYVMSDEAHNVSQECTSAMEQGNREVGDYVNEYDVLLDVCYPSLVEQELRLKRKVTKMSLGVDVCMTYERRFYFNLPEVQHALHANRTNLPYSWSMCSGLLSYSSLDGNINILPVLKSIIQQGIRVWIFSLNLLILSGDQDSVVPLVGSRMLVHQLAEDLQLKVSVPYRAWYQNGQVAGWATAYGNILTFATVRGAAHMVPYSQPSRSLALFQTFLSGKDLPDQSRR
ncbi:hypothetical protein KI387_036103 [Taxus chinensis]|uniref:Carboxypeptidase n=1 Tax=Taxus chinensis TaxID=29808 RepID=A0AA38FPC2_TAXCH|nr:hypothetical protein KI387_036103 [Taxus chinensis]